MDRKRTQPLARASYARRRMSSRRRIPRVSSPCVAGSWRPRTRGVASPGTPTAATRQPPRFAA